MNKRNDRKRKEIGEQKKWTFVFKGIKLDNSKTHANYKYGIWLNGGEEG